MYVARLVMENVKSYRGRHELEFDSGLNFLIGDNNTGKSSIFDALQYLVGDKVARDAFYAIGSADPTRVEVVLAGSDLPMLLSTEKYAKLGKYLHPEARGLGEVLRIQRRSDEWTSIQGGREYVIDEKKVTLWNPESRQFENATGIDALVKGLCELLVIAANVDPSEYLDFAGTKVLGRLLADSSRQFQESESWRRFCEAHTEAFLGNGEGALARLSADVIERLAAVVRTQYGEASARVEFDRPDPALLIKAGRVMVDDGQGETTLSSKGSGMQRAFTLAALQLLAETRSESSNLAPFILLVDEPETWLHPRAQLKLAHELAVLAEKQQVFVITHSPYLLRAFKAGSHRLLILKAASAEQRWVHGADLGILSGGVPSWGEINYGAFDLVSQEFHNELFGLVTRHLEEAGSRKEPTLKAIDAFLVDAGLTASRRWQRPNSSASTVSTPVFVRNAIHHPENPMASSMTHADLRQGIVELLQVIQARGLAGQGARAIGS